MCPHSGHISVTWRGRRGQFLFKRTVTGDGTNLEQMLVCIVDLGLCLALLPQGRREGLGMRFCNDLDVLIGWRWTAFVNITSK